MSLVLRAVARCQLPETAACAWSAVQLWCQSSTGWASHHSWWQCLAAVPSSADHLMLWLQPFLCHCQNKCLHAATSAMIFFLIWHWAFFGIGCLYCPFHLSMSWPFIYGYSTFMTAEVFVAYYILSVCYIARLTPGENISLVVNSSLSCCKTHFSALKPFNLSPVDSLVFRMAGSPL